MWNISKIVETFLCVVNLKFYQSLLLELLIWVILLINLWAGTQQCQVLHKDTTLSIRKSNRWLWIWERKSNNSAVLGVMMNSQHPKCHLHWPEEFWGGTWILEGCRGSSAQVLKVVWKEVQIKVILWDLLIRRCWWIGPWDKLTTGWRLAS